MSQFEAPWGNYILKDIVETSAPAPISWWPQTIAWQVLLIALLCALFLKGYRHYKKYLANAYRRDALVWLNELPIYQANEPAPIFRQLPALLKKTAITAFDRTQVSQLSDQRWELWLDAQCQDSQFSKRCSSLLHKLSYQRDHQISAQQMQVLQKTILHWIKFHRGQHD
ncbi:MAG: DUF4381 domain-containing protein [Colwellia sp.]